MNHQEFIDYFKEHVPDLDWHCAILEDGEVVEVHFAEALVWQCENQDKIRVARTQVGEFDVSTVFSTTDFNGHRSEKHHHFETMIFGPDQTHTYGRYQTLKEAWEGHKVACAQAKNLDWNLKHGRRHHY